MMDLIYKAKHVKVGDVTYLVVTYDNEYRDEEYMFRYNRNTYSRISTLKLIGLTRSEAIEVINEELLYDEIKGEIL